MKNLRVENSYGVNFASKKNSLMWKIFPNNFLLKIYSRVGHFENECQIWYRWQFEIRLCIDSRN